MNYTVNINENLYYDITILVYLPTNTGTAIRIPRRTMEQEEQREKRQVTNRMEHSQVISLYMYINILAVPDPALLGF